MKIIKFLICAVMCSALLFTVCSAQVYTEDYPLWCPASGASWMEVNTSQGKACVVVPYTFRFDTFGFYGSSGYVPCNLTNSTLNGYIYFNNASSYFGNPTELQCRFSSFGTLQVYEPYQNNYNGTSYRWSDLGVSSVLNTNIGFMDEAGDRQNDAYVYSTTEKLLILVFIAQLGLILLFVLRSAWRA